MLELDAEEMRVWIDGKEIELSRRQFQILALLEQHQGRFVPTERILTAVWGDDSLDVYAHVVPQHVYKLRRKLPGLIRSRYHRGYQLVQA